MINSRNIDDLNHIVAAKCRAFLAACEAQGIDIIITSTYRDNESQDALYYFQKIARRDPGYRDVKDRDRRIASFSSFLSKTFLRARMLCSSSRYFLSSIGNCLVIPCMAEISVRAEISSGEVKM